MIVDPPKSIVSTITFSNYSYNLCNLIAHTSVDYTICLFDDLMCVKTILGTVNGDQYTEWTTDDWMDAFIASIVDEL